MNGEHIAMTVQNASAQVENQIIGVSNTCKTSLNNSMFSFRQLLINVGMRDIG